MRAITEDFLRYELRSSQPEVYVIPQGKILTPAAREYLQQRKIRVEKEGGQTGRHPCRVQTPMYGRRYGILQSRSHGDVPPGKSLSD